MAGKLILIVVCPLFALFTGRVPYLQVAIRALKAIHSATHPADAKLRRHAEPQAHRDAVRDEAKGLAALFAALEGEAVEELAEVTRH